MLQGLLNARRPPHIVCSGSGIRFAQSLKYLGVTLQAGLKWDMHMRDVTKKAKKLFHALTHSDGKLWGYQAVQYGIL